MRASGPGKGLPRSTRGSSWARHSATGGGRPPAGSPVAKPRKRTWPGEDAHVELRQLQSGERRHLEGAPVVARIAHDDAETRHHFATQIDLEGLTRGKGQHAQTREHVGQAAPAGGAGPEDEE